MFWPFTFQQEMLEIWKTTTTNLSFKLNIWLLLCVKKPPTALSKSEAVDP
jgi:hypothetical protein